MFITFEGCDHVGKTSTAKRLAEKLNAERPTIYTFEPGGTDLANDIRKILRHRYPNENLNPSTALLLISAARVQHILNVIAPSLKDGKTVVCDRYIDSTRVYQGLVIDESYIEAFVQEAPEPDVTFLLTCDPDKLMERSKKRNEVDQDHYDKRKALQPKIQNKYLQLAKDFKDRFYVVDTTNTVASEVLDICYKKVKDFQKTADKENVS